MKWNGEVFVDVALPFGLWSALKFLNALADGLEWILMQQGTCQVLHYLDDFLFVGGPHALTVRTLPGSGFSARGLRRGHLSISQSRS